MIKVGIDCWALRINGAGARYVFESLFSHIENNKKYKFILFLHPEAEICIHELQSNIGILKNTIKIKINSPGEILQYQRFVDVFYSPFNNISFRYFVKPVVSLLHDVQERYLPELFLPEELEGRHEDYDDIVRSSTRTITISRFCKKSLVEHCGGEENKIDVVYNAPQQSLLRYVNSEVVSNSHNKFDLRSNDFIFYPANFYAHKNHDRLLDAYAQCLTKNEAMPELVFMGMLSENSDVSAKIRALGLQDKVKILSRLPSDELAWLYANCRYVIIPSLFEGFCLPAVEALAFNKHVLCSNLDILKEVTLGQATYFRPSDIQDIREKMLDQLLISEKNTVNIEDHFSWSVAADKTLTAIDKAMSEYYKKQTVLQALSESKFVVYIDGDNSSFKDIEATIFSIVQQKDVPCRLDLFISFQEKASQNVHDDFTSLISNLSWINIYTTFQEFNAHNERQNYFAYLVGGNTISENYFLNIVRAFIFTDCSLVIGELHQVHEDKIGTFEEAIYFRVNRGNLILNGHFYPEMFVSRKFDYIECLKNDKHGLARYVKNKITSETAQVARVNLANVLFKHSLLFKRNVSRKSRLGFTPVNFVADPVMPELDKLIEDQQFIDYVSSDVAMKLGKECPPDIFEAKRQMRIIKNWERAV